jgi:hypothetical protein
LNQQAGEAFRDYQELVEKRLAPGSPLAAIADWGGKVLGETARIAATLHNYQHAADPTARPLDLETMDSAMQLMDYFQPHALVAFDAMGVDPVIAGAQRLLAWLAPKKWRQFSERAAFQDNKGYFNRMSRLRPALAILVERGYIRPAAEPAYVTRGPGRPPGPRYEVNPALYRIADQNPQNSKRCGVLHRVKELCGF